MDNSKEYYIWASMISWFFSGIYLHASSHCDDISIFSIKGIFFIIVGVFFLSMIFGYVFYFLMGIILINYSVEDMFDQQILNKIILIKRVIKIINMISVIFITKICFDYYYFS